MSLIAIGGKVMKLIKVACVSVFISCTGVIWAQSAGPTDPQIAAIVVTANQVDIDAGKLAMSRSNTRAVKDFAQLMITDHSGVNKSAVDLVTKLHVTPESNPTSESLTRSSFGLSSRYRSNAAIARPAAAFRSEDRAPSLRKTARFAVPRFSWSVGI